MTQLTVHEKSSCKDAKFFDTIKKSSLPYAQLLKKCIFARSLYGLVLKDFAQVQAMASEKLLTKKSFKKL